jgi:hypothetical protein
MKSHPAIAPSLTERPGDWPDLDWTWIRGVVDWVRLHPEATQDAISIPPHSDATSHTQNLLAAIAEKIADDAKLPRPRWTHAISASKRPLKRSIGTTRMVERDRARAPEQFRNRNIWLAKEEFFRR